MNQIRENAPVLAGDIGGTKTLLQLLEVRPEGRRVLHEHQYASADFEDFADVLRHFLQAAAVRRLAAPGAACIGVAGPVQDGRARVTNLSWQLDARRLAAACAIDQLHLINDFQAIGYGLEGLSPAELHSLQAGQPVARGARVVIGAGTGLGEGALYWQEDHYDILASEGGHADFAPADEVQLELLQYLRQRESHVCYDVILSGRGIHHIFCFLRDRGRGRQTAELAATIAAGDPAAAISAAADTGDVLAAQTLRLFCAIYGAQAGNLALTVVARGGVYVAGGIAPRIISWLQGGEFMRAFVNKGKMTELMRSLPVQVVLNPKVGVLGAALYAARHR